ncbi:MAG: hypothetical protein EOR30_27630 [Mesorhizobium sp.]|nr:MAG: hypothetical protein EOQ45_30190 [Mesorhizobium sp.]RWJ45218.1 MAG: hypothetical protein EOR30_27630 [Mesorhizobium sp.]RWJ56596.1 MAG: hypothetical protein EOR32_34460 [Mesorhizobium sp.]RWJ60849.1 MAG: hypothetical protein EOR34_35325 [Mesorhizobium sp.]RWJ91609.1 MAG: hypothetical protein EOR38_34025 [Mesorhizobium sp.]
MRPSRFTEEQIIGMLKDQEAGGKTADFCRKPGISAATFYKFKAKFVGMDQHTPHCRSEIVALIGQHTRLIETEYASTLTDRYAVSEAECSHLVDEPGTARDELIPDAAKRLAGMGRKCGIEPQRTARISLG